MRYIGIIWCCFVKILKCFVFIFCCNKEFYYICNEEEKFYYIKRNKFLEVFFFGFFDFYYSNIFLFFFEEVKFNRVILFKVIFFGFYRIFNEVFEF